MKRFLPLVFLAACAAETGETTEHDGLYEGEDAAVAEEALSTRCALGVCGLPVRCSSNVGNADVRSVSVTAPIGMARTMDLPSPHQMSWVNTARRLTSTEGGIYLRRASTTCHLVSYRIRAICRASNGSSISRNMMSYEKHWFAPGDGVTNAAGHGGACLAGETFAASIVDGTVHGAVFTQ